MSMESITEVKNMRIDVLGVGFDNLTMTEAVSRGAALLELSLIHISEPTRP